MLKEDKLATEIKEQYQKWLDSRKDWDTQAREDIDFYLATQWAKGNAKASSIKKEKAKDGSWYKPKKMYDWMTGRRI